MALSAEEHADYKRLRRAATVRHRKTRHAGASLVLLVALLLAPPAVIAAWVDDTVTDTGRYVQTVAPLAKEPAVQAVVTDRLTNRVVANVDVEAVTASFLVLVVAVLSVLAAAAGRAGGTAEPGRAVP